MDGLKHFHERPNYVIALRQMVCLKTYHGALKLRLLYGNEFRELDVQLNESLNSATVDKLLVLQPAEDNEDNLVIELLVQAANLSPSNLNFR